MESQRKAEQVTWAKFHVDLIGNTNPAVVWNLREPLASTADLVPRFLAPSLQVVRPAAFKAQSVIVAMAEQGIARVQQEPEAPRPSLRSLMAEFWKDLGGAL